MCPPSTDTGAQLISAAKFGGLSLPPGACDGLETSLPVEMHTSVILQKRSYAEIGWHLVSVVQWSYI